MHVYEPTDEELALAIAWHGGQSTMLYAIASTGALSTGTIRPRGDDGPMTDDEWVEHLLWRLACELREISRYDTAEAEEDRETILAWLAKVDD